MCIVILAGVLILVLMEDALVPSCGDIYGGVQGVLILVLMEDALVLRLSPFLFHTAFVLILVLMEDALVLYNNVLNHSF